MMNVSNISTIYVSQKHGNWMYTGFKKEEDGNYQGPLGSVEDAVKLIRDMRRAGANQPITVVITDDVYNIETPVRIDNSVNADSVLQATKECIDEAYTLSERKAESIEKIVNGLITSGMGIAYSGSSRPASGTEHMIGQTWEIMDLESGRELQLHGHDVGAATFVAISMYKKLYNETDDMEIKKLIEKYLPAFDRILDLQKTLKLPITAPEKDKFVEGCLRGRTFRVRYTLLEYLYKKGILEEYIEAAYNEVVLGK